MFAIEKDSSIIVIDAGLSFPSDEMLGIDLVLPDFTYLAERAGDVLGVILTHGHEDHVGALSWFLRDVPVPVHGTPLTLGLARRRLDEFGVKADFREINAPGTLEIGPFKCHFIAVSHSIPDALAVAVDTSDGRLLYTGDFKLDDSPIDGRLTDLVTIGRLADEGIDLLLSDSTNADEPGRTGSEALVGDKLDEIFASATRSIIVACFASNLHRIQQVCTAAEKVGRHVAFVGRSMIANAEVGRELGHLKVSHDTIVDIGDIDHLPPDKVAIICTGSQGEPLSALSLISAGEHKVVRVEEDDTVILSASPIPGNESSVHRVINGLYRARARVFHGEEDGVHVSGHAASDELREMLVAAKPHNFIPVHGEFRMLTIHSQIAQEVGIDPSVIKLCEDGDVIEMADGKVTRGDKVRSGTILVDGLGVGDVGPVVLRDRKVLAGDGIVICVVTIDSRTGEILAGPDIVSRGFVFEDEAQDFLNEAEDRVEEALRALEHEKVTDWQAIKKAVRRSLGEYVWKETRRRPMIMPIVTEV
ncbi:MAG: ribonuclease [Actinomycetota bacterium]|jgi:ribonuclease J|nr:ribonuclease [Actinomycetota bacterium]